MFISCDRTLQYIYFAQLWRTHPENAGLYDGSLIVRKYVEILLFFILWNVTGYPCYK